LEGAAKIQGVTMAISEFCHRDVVCATRDTTVTEAANLMRQHHVGDVIIVETRWQASSSAS
jgi:CBS domain-containing protein